MRNGYTVYMYEKKIIFFTSVLCFVYCSGKETVMEIKVYMRLERFLWKKREKNVDSSFLLDIYVFNILQNSRNKR